MKWFAALSLAVLASCTAPHRQSMSLCELPRSLATSEQTDFRWKGVLINTGQHGVLFMATDCPRRGAGIADWPDNQDDALDRVSEQSWREPGVIRVDFGGRINRDGMLDVTKVHDIRFEPMSKQQEAAFERALDW
jgi:hypothetical protein